MPSLEIDEKYYINVAEIVIAIKSIGNASLNLKYKNPKLLLKKLNNNIAIKDVIITCPLCFLSFVKNINMNINKQMKQ